MAAGRSFGAYDARCEFGAVIRNHLTSYDLLQAPPSRRLTVALKSFLQSANMRDGKDNAVVYMVVRSVVTHGIVAHSDTETNFWPNGGLYGHRPGCTELYSLFSSRPAHQPFYWWSNCR